MATSSRILYGNQVATGGVHVANAVRYANLAMQELELAVTIMNSITGGGATPANLETPQPDFEVETGKGSTFYTTVNDFKSNMATAVATPVGTLYQG